MRGGQVASLLHLSSHIPERQPRWGEYPDRMAGMVGRTSTSFQRSEVDYRAQILDTVHLPCCGRYRLALGFPSLEERRPYHPPSLRQTCRLVPSRQNLKTAHLPQIASRGIHDYIWPRGSLTLPRLFPLDEVYCSRHVRLGKHRSDPTRISLESQPSSIDLIPIIESSLVTFDVATYRTYGLLS